MLHSDVNTLIKLIDSWQTAKSSSSQFPLGQYIEQIWEQFQIVHQSYKHAFQNYVKMINDEENITEIREQITLDPIFSNRVQSAIVNLIEQLRKAYSELYSTSNTFVGSKLAFMDLSQHKIDFEPIDLFIARLEHYFELTNHAGDRSFENSTRHIILVNNSNIEPLELKNIMMDSVQNLQSAYDKCEQSYFLARTLQKI